MPFDSARHAACSTLHAVCCTLHAVAPCCSIYAVYLRIVQVVFNTLIGIVTHPQPALISCCFIIRPSFCLHLCEKVKKKTERERKRGRRRVKKPFPVSLAYFQPELADKLLQTVSFHLPSFFAFLFILAGVSCGYLFVFNFQIVQDTATNACM